MTASPTQAMVDAALIAARRFVGRYVCNEADATQMSRARRYAYHALMSAFPDSRNGIVKALGIMEPSTFVKSAAAAPSAPWWREDAYRRVVERLRVAMDRHEAVKVAAERRAENKAKADAERRAQQAERKAAKEAAAAAQRMKLAADLQRHDRALAQAREIGESAKRVAEPPSKPARVYTRMAPERTGGRGLATAKPDEWWLGLPEPSRGRRASITAAFCGDPAPGRSALDQRQGGRA